MITIIRPSPPKQRGFTLVELMIVVLVVAILAAIAYPVYTSQVRKAKRADAKSKLTKAVNRAEQFYSQKHYYPTSLKSIHISSITSNKAYKIIVVPNTSVGIFKVRALAQGNQTKGVCTRFTLSSNGTQYANNKKESNDPHNCW